MVSDTGHRWRDEWVWLRPFHLITAVAVFSILPYIDRGTAQSLGKWVLIAPILALLIVGFGLVRLVKSGRNSAKTKNKTDYAAILFLLTFLIATAANCWVVATLWIVAEPIVATPVATSEMKTSNLEDAIQAKDVQTLASSSGGGLANATNLHYMDPDVRSALKDVKCTHVADATNPTFANEFECNMPSDPAAQRPACRFNWKVTPIVDAESELAVVSNRQDVVSKFATSGYGKWGLSGGSPNQAPYVGVAFVACSDGSLPNPISNWNLRVAFVLSKAADVRKYNSLFRTVGFDWVTPQYFARPYLAELFALTSLYDVSELVFKGAPPLAQTMTSNRHDDLLGVEELGAFRQVGWTNVRIGNNSDGQLGNSRGSCLLVAAVSGLAKIGGTQVHVAPSAVTPVLSTVDRSLVLMRTGGDPISVPCTLFSALLTRDMSLAKNYPPALTGTSVRYYLSPGESTSDAMRRGFNVRAAGLTLYLLGFGVSYDGKERPAQVTGSWPRDEFIGAVSPTGSQ
ncbi:MAG: hypothetical protein QOH71_1474 [Blastocatellia bacterium]|jgi:hypothetical protein|nr:hypothetical protein [Blastocatellia bacterium]